MVVLTSYPGVWLRYYPRLFTDEAFGLSEQFHDTGAVVVVDAIIADCVVFAGVSPSCIS